MKKFFLAGAFLMCVCTLAAQQLGQLVDSLRMSGNFPGLSVAIIKKDKLEAFVSGMSDVEKQIPLTVNDGLMQGSVGKTYAAAMAVRLISGKKISLDDKVGAYLGSYEWYNRIPNSQQITIRMIMNHTSGVMRYEFKPQFLKDLAANPDRVWKPEDLLQYVLDEKASFAAGEGWEYSDTNFILLGMIIEKVTGKKYYELLASSLLRPFKLNSTWPSDSRTNRSLVQGYAGAKNEFGGQDKVINDNGQFIINPQFEWTGGGVYSTTSDLARWINMLYKGRVCDTSLMIREAVPAKLGRDTKYGLGVIVRNSPLGVTYGHSGFFPGYMTEAYYFPEKDMTVAVQCNTSDFEKVKLNLYRVLSIIAVRAAAD